jgi:hypothetical protein
MPNFLAVDNFELLVLYSQPPFIVRLPTGAWVEKTLIEDNDIECIGLLHVVKDINDLATELRLLMVLVVEVLCFREMHCIIEHQLSSLGDSFGSCRDLDVQVRRNRLTRDFGYRIGRDA